MSHRDLVIQYPALLIAVALVAFYILSALPKLDAAIKKYGA